MPLDILAAIIKAFDLDANSISFDWEVFKQL